MKSVTVLKYIKRVNEAYRHWVLKSIKLPYMPYIVTIEPTNYCNLKCPKCLHGYNYPREQGFMPYELFEKIIRENAHHIWNSCLMYGGESLLHPDLPRMIRLAKEYGIWQVSLHTNGCFLTEDMSYQLIEAGLDTLVFSFDGDDKETYEKLQKGANFEKTIANIRRFLEIKKNLNIIKPFVSIKTIRSLVDQPSSMSADFVKYFEGLPINRIYFEKLYAQGEYGEKLLRDRHWDVFNYDRLNQQAIKDYFPCYNVYSEVVITWQGKVIRCCRDQECLFEMGDLGKETIADVWNNDAFLSIRENLKRKVLDGPCKRCSSLWCGRPVNYPKRNFFEYVTFPKYLIRFYYPEFSRKLFSIPALNRIFSD